MNRPKKEDYVVQYNFSYGSWDEFDSERYQEALNNYIEQLEIALDKACDELQETDVGTTCDEKYHKQCRENHCFKTCIHARPLTKKEWKEWCFEE